MDAANNGNPAPIPAGPPPLVKVKTTPFNLLKRGAVRTVPTQPNRDLNGEQARATVVRPPVTPSDRASSARAVSQPAAGIAAAASRSDGAASAAAASERNAAAAASQRNAADNAAAASERNAAANAAAASQRNAAEQDVREASATPARQAATNASAPIKRGQAFRQHTRDLNGEQARATDAQTPASTPSDQASLASAASQSAATSSQRNDAATAATTSRSDGTGQNVREASATPARQTATNVSAPIKRGRRFSVKGCLLKGPSGQDAQNGGASAAASGSHSSSPLSNGSSAAPSSSNGRDSTTSRPASGASRQSRVQQAAAASASVRAGDRDASLDSPFGPIGFLRAPPASAGRSRAPFPEPTREVLSSIPAVTRPAREPSLRRLIRPPPPVIAEEDEDQLGTDTNESDEASAEAGPLADSREHSDVNDADEVLVPWADSPQHFAIIMKKFAKLQEENREKITAETVQQRPAVSVGSLRSYKLYARNINGHWHRIRLTGPPTIARSREFSLDDGALRPVTSGLVDIMYLDLSNEPFAYKCRLSSVRPKDNEAGWSNAAAAAFQRRLNAARRISVPDLRLPDWPSPAEVNQPEMVFPVSDIFADGASVSQALVEEGHAEWS